MPFHSRAMQVLRGEGKISQKVDSEPEKLFLLFLGVLSSSTLAEADSTPRSSTAAAFKMFKDTRKEIHLTSIIDNGNPSKDASLSEF